MLYVDGGINVQRPRDWGVHDVRRARSVPYSDRRAKQSAELTGEPIKMKGQMEHCAHVLLELVLRRVGRAVRAQLDHGLVRVLHDGARLGVRDCLGRLLQRRQQPRQEHRRVVGVVHHLRREASTSG